MLLRRSVALTPTAVAPTSMMMTSARRGAAVATSFFRRPTNQQQQTTTSTTNLSVATAQLKVSHRGNSNLMGGYGSMVPFQGYVSNDIITAAVPGGGQHRRGVQATTDLPYDREIMRLPAYLLYVGDVPPRKAVPQLVKTLLKRFVNDRRHASYITKRMLSLMVGGNPIFRSEDDVNELILDVDGASELVSKGLLSSLDLHRLGCIIWFNRFECEYKGQKGIALFPEVSFFNHSCEPNVGLTFHWDVETGDYVCCARTLKPVHGGDQLVIHYMPECAELPLSRW